MKVFAKRKRLNPSRVYNPLEIVGNTPLIHLLNSSPSSMKLFAKLEWMPSGKPNPLSSIKDRAAYFMIRDAEEREEIRRGEKIIIEATSGNTGIALARIGKSRGYDVVVVIPGKTSEGTKRILRSLGAEVIETSDDLCPRVGSGTDQSIALARAMVLSNPKRRREGMIEYFMPNQYENDSNFLAHYRTTGPEIWRQTKGRVTHVFAGVGTGGTLSGVERYLKERNPEVKVYAVEPQQNHRIQGLRNFTESGIPKVLERRVDVDKKKGIGEWLQVSDDEAFETVRKLALEEEILAGCSSGAALSAALRIAEEEKGLGVVIFPDSGEKYRELYLELNLFTDRELSILFGKKPRQNENRSLALIHTFNPSRQIGKTANLSQRKTKEKTATTLSDQCS